MEGPTAASQKSTLKKRLAIFASYDGNHVVNDYVVYYLNELNKISDIIFVADNPLNEAEQERIRPLTICTLAENHGEYDFGSYKRGYTWAQSKDILSNYDQLIFCNDSVFGPICPLDYIFSEMDRRDKIDFWGMFLVEKNSRARSKPWVKAHIQSYFIVFNHPIITSEILSDFIYTIKKQKFKEEVIKKYEVGLSQKLIQEKFKFDGFIRGDSNMPQNENALKLIEKGFPFLKKSLFTSEHEGRWGLCYDLWKYKSIITKIAPDYPVELIEDYTYKCLGKKNIRIKLLKLRFRIPIISRSLFYKKVTKKGHLIIKVLSIIVYRKKLNVIEFPK